MKKFTKLGALALASALSISVVAATSPASAADCAKRTKVVMLGTIKIEIQDQFLAAVKAYNASQTCYTLESIPGDRKLTFLQNVTPLYAAKNAPTIMYTLQEIPDMADKVMDWKGSKLAKLVAPSLLEAATVGGKLVGVPSTAEAFGLLYNKKVLDKLAIDPTKITTRSALEIALRKAKKAGNGGVRFSSIWWSLGAHFSNIFFADTSASHEALHAVLDDLADH